MGLNPNRVTRVVWGLAALLSAAIALDAALLWRDEARNALIAAGTPPAETAVPDLRFAQAYALAGSGAGEAALNTYRGLQSDSALGAAARFNSANLLLRQALELRAGAQPAQALPLIELAKEQYRALLRQDPQHWDARYNLERAQRLLPDPQDAEFEPTAAPRERERAATTMRAQTLGLP
jgi:mxaK protein